MGTNLIGSHWRGEVVLLVATALTVDLILCTFSLENVIISITLPESYASNRNQGPIQACPGQAVVPGEEGVT